eukprot:UN34050
MLEQLPSCSTTLQTRTSSRLVHIKSSKIGLAKLTPQNSDSRQPNSGSSTPMMPNLPSSSATFQTRTSSRISQIKTTSRSHKCNTS